MHGANIRLVSLIKPKIIIKGGSIYGVYLINDIPSVYNGTNDISVIKFKDKVISKILQYRYEFDLKSKQLMWSPMRTISPCSHWYEWLKPYKE